MFDWKWDFTLQILPRLIEATGNTLMAAGIGYGIALIVGLVFTLAQKTPYRVLTFIVRETVEFIRSTPLVLQIFFIFYVGPQFGIRLSPWVSGMIAIGLHYAAYLSEVYRGALDAVDSMLDEGGLDALDSRRVGDLAQFRRFELAAALNRLRTLRVD